MAKKTGGLAFPGGEADDHGFIPNGMTMRQYYAKEGMNCIDAKFASLISFSWAAHIAFCYADAMIAEDEKAAK